MAFDATAMTDGFGRRFHYLRLSVTEVCNFSCTYCLPNGWKKTGPLSFLTAEEIGRLVAGFSDLGLSKVRLTGGEPTVRKDFNAIIETVAAAPGVAKVAMTTNGWNLARHAVDWRASGLSHINVSIDSIDPETFHQITGHDKLNQVLTGLDLALAEGFSAVKVNAVLLRETAEAGFDGWARFVRDRPVAVRFIELMKTTDNDDYFARHHVKAQGLRDWLDQNGWTPTERAFDAGPALEYRHPDHAGAIGLIAPYAPGFCESCNRLRVTARGKLRLCLFGDGGVDLRDLLQDDEDREALTQHIVSALGGKSAGHSLALGRSGDLRNLAQLGG